MKNFIYSLILGFLAWFTIRGLAVSAYKLGMIEHVYAYSVCGVLLAVGSFATLLKSIRGV